MLKQAFSQCLIELMESDNTDMLENSYIFNRQTMMLDVGDAEEGFKAIFGEASNSELAEERQCHVHINNISNELKSNLCVKLSNI